MWYWETSTIYIYIYIHHFSSNLNRFLPDVWVFSGLAHAASRLDSRVGNEQEREEMTMDDLRVRDR